MSRTRSRSSADDADESIYNLIPQPTTASSRPALYRSKYPHDTAPTGSTFGKSVASANLTTNLEGSYEVPSGTHRHKLPAANFGPKLGHSSDPSRFQKANAQPTLPQPTRFEYTTRVKPPLETHHAPTSPVVAARSAAAQASATKNFISENALAVIMAEARRPVKQEIDYRKKEDFGKTPAYLAQVKAEIAAEQAYIRSVLESEQAQLHAHEPKTVVLPEEERLQLLQALKLKWEAVNKQYQTTTHMVTLGPGPRKLKESLENELDTIEKSIDKLSKPFVFVQAY